MNKLATLACKHLNETYHTNTSIQSCEDINGEHGTLLRVVLDNHDDLPKHIFIKQLPKGEARIDPRTRFLSEWAGLQFCSQISTDTILAPRFLVGDLDEQYVVMEDIQDAVLLRDALNDPNSKNMAQVLENFGVFLAEFHAASLGKEDDFIAIQQGLGFDAPPRNDSSIDLRERIDEARTSYAFLAIDLSDDFFAEVHKLSEALYAKTPFRVFNHHDAGTHNILIRGEQPMFIDFEFSEYGSLFMDFSAAFLAYPPHGRGRPVPQEILERYTNAYRRTMAHHIPQIMDDALFEKMLHYACGQWMLSKTIGRGGDRLETYFINGSIDDLPEHVTVESLARWRQLLLTQIWCFLDLLKGTPHIPEIYKILQAVHDTALKREPDLAILPVWNALL